MTGPSPNSADPPVDLIAVAEEDIRKKSSQLRRSRTTIIVTLLAALGYLPFAIASPWGDIGYWGYAATIVGVLIGSTRARLLRQAALRPSMSLLHPEALSVLERAAIDSDRDTRFVARRHLDGCGVSSVSPADQTDSIDGTHTAEDLETSHDEKGKVDAFVKSLINEDFRVRSLAISQLGRLSGDTLRSVSAALVAMKNRLARRVRAWSWTAIGIPSLLFTADELSMVGTPMWNSWQNHVQDVGFYAMLGLCIGWPTLRMRRQLAGAKIALTKLDDPHVCGSLIESLQSGDRDTRQFAESALVRLLPRVSPADRALFPRPVRDVL